MTRDGRRATGMLLAAVLAVAAGPAFAPAGGGQTPLTPEQALELRNSSAQLADPARSAKTKLEAAELLLTRSYPQAAEALAEFLSDASNRPAQVAVAGGIARLGVTRPTFIEPLMTMLAGPSATARAAAARALAAYKDPAVTGALIDLARSAKADSAVRLDAIAALSRVLDKDAVDALVGLLGDRDPAICAAAAESLAKLTSIRAFGTDLRQWRQWWRKNKDKPRSEWLVDLANSLLTSKAALEIENARLRERLVGAMEQLYAATGAAQRDALLMSFLRDVLPEVRQVGLRLVERKLAAGENVGKAIRPAVGAMLADADPGVRQQAARLVAAIGNGQATAALLARLKVEDQPPVREAIVNAVGQMQDPVAVPALLDELASGSPALVTAAARALAQVAGRASLSAEQRERASEALIAKYRLYSADGDEPPEAREALLTAMGVVGSEAFVPVLTEALADPSALVRLAAVNGLVKLNRRDRVEEIARLAGDADRGVRQAVIVALRALDGQNHLDVFLRRSGPGETDPAVRKQAWQAVMAVLADSDVATIAKVVEELADREDAGDQRISTLELLVQALQARKSPDLPAGLRQLAAELMAAGRPSEAAGHLAEAYEILSTARSPAAAEVWSAWLSALLASPDPRAAKVLAEAPDDDALAAGFAQVAARLEELVEAGRYAQAADLAAAGDKLAGSRLTDPQRKRLNALGDRAAEGRADQARRRVATLTARLSEGDPEARAAAAAELREMGRRAFRPLTLRLKEAISAESTDAELEQAILAILKQIDPSLSGYDPSAPVAERVRRLDKWLSAPEAGG